MIAERFPGLMSISAHERWQVVNELQEGLLAEYSTEKEPLKSEIVAALERSLEHYHQHPESAISLDELTRRIKAQDK